MNVKTGFLANLVVGLLLLMTWLYAIDTAYAQTEVKKKDQVRDLIAKLDSKDANERRAIAKELTGCGESAIPQLIEALKTCNNLVRNYLYDALAGIGRPVVPQIGVLLDDPVSETRSRALQVLSQIGPDAGVLMPKLLKMFEDPDRDMRLVVLRVMEAIGPDAEPVVPALIKALPNRNAIEALYIISVLERIGPGAKAAVPELICVVTTRDSSLRTKAIVALGKIGPNAAESVPILMKALQEGETEAIKALGGIGPAAAPAIPLLLEQLNNMRNSHDEEAISTALGGIGKVCLPALIPALKNENPQVRRAVAKAIGLIGQNAKEAIPVLVTLLQDEHWEVSKNAAESLGKMAPESIPGLVAALDYHHAQNDELFRSFVEKSICTIGPAAKPVIPKLISMIETGKGGSSTQDALASMGTDAIDPIAAALKQQQDDNHLEFDSMGKLIEVLGKIGVPAIPQLIQVMKREDRRYPFPSASSRVLVKIGPPTVPALIEVLQEKNATPRRRAIYILKEIGSPSKDAAPALMGLIGDNDQSVSKEAAEALATIGAGVSAETQAKLIQMLASAPNPQERMAAAIVLGGTGKISHEVIAALIKALKDDAPETRSEAMKSIRKHAAEAHDAMPVFIEMLQDPSPKVRHDGAKTLTEFGPDAKVAIPSLIKTLKTDSDKIVREAALKTLGSIGPDAKETIPVLISLLEDAYKGDRPEVGSLEMFTKTLGNMGAAPAVPTLIRLLQSPEAPIRKIAADALGKIGPPARDAIPYLRKLLNEKDASAYSSIKSALSQIQSMEAKIPYELVKNEIPSDLEEFRHFEISLKIEGSENTIFLSRLRVYTGAQKYNGNMGIDEETLAFEWLQTDRLLHISWLTCPQGQGTNTRQTHLILIKQKNSWQQIYRDSQPFYARHGFMIRYAFYFQQKSGTLTIQEDDYTPLFREEFSPAQNNVVKQDPGVLNPNKVTYLTEWRFKLVDGTLQYMDGTISINVNERTMDVYDPASEENNKREYDIHALAKFLAPKNEKAMVAHLRELNPALRKSDVCSGQIVFKSGIKWRGADEKDYYTIEE